MVEWLQRLRSFPQRSIFFKLFLIFLFTAFVLVLIIRGFFLLTLDRNQSFKADLFRNLTKYSEQLVEDIGHPPNLEQANRLAQELGTQFRVNTPDEQWATDPSLPAFAELRVDNSFSTPGTLVGQYRRHPFVIMTREGSTFGIFFLHRPFGELPVWSFALLVGLVGTVIAGSYLMVRRLIRPVNWLTQGVGEIAKGHFNFKVPVGSSDELGELTKSFNDMAQRVNEMIQARDRLLLDVSHELRSPLTRMKVAAEFIQNEPAKEKIQQEVRELDTMVTELLETERLKSNPGGLTLAETDLVTLAKEVAQGYFDVKPGVQLVAPPESVQLPLDRQRIIMALRNLVENALKHTRQEYGPINIKIEKHKDSVAMLIRDFGPGIQPEEHSRIFEPFYRVDPSRTRDTGGYGLGLSLAKKIMAAHGGDLMLISEQGQGSTFIMKFPVT
jgi:signal transduction histidine kinase